MISTKDFFKGIKILFNNEPYVVIDYHHVKPGKGGAFVKTKMKNLVTGFVREETFRSGEKFSEPDLTYHKMQYLYTGDDLYYFMDQESFDQIILNRDQINDVLDYLKEEEIYSILYFDKKPVTVTPPMFMEFMITKTLPGVKGDTVQGAGSKPATLETGLVIQVPLFVEEGEKIKVDTREGIYIERVKN